MNKRRKSRHKGTAHKSKLNQKILTKNERNIADLERLHLGIRESGKLDLARSLLSHFKRKGVLSDAQWHYVSELANMVRASDRKRRNRA